MRRRFRVDPYVRPDVMSCTVKVYDPQSFSGMRFCGAVAPYNVRWLQRCRNGQTVWFGSARCPVHAAEWASSHGLILPPIEAPEHAFDIVSAALDAAEQRAGETSPDVDSIVSATLPCDCAACQPRRQRLREMIAARERAAEERGMEEAERFRQCADRGLELAVQFGADRQRAYEAIYQPASALRREG